MPGKVGRPKGVGTIPCLMRGSQGLFTVVADPDNPDQWLALLRNPSRTCIAFSAPRESGRQGRRYFFRTPGGRILPYQGELSPQSRKPKENVRYAGWAALFSGWLAKIISDAQLHYDNLTNIRELAKVIEAPAEEVITVGSVTHLVRTTVLARAANTTEDRVLQFLRSLDCPIYELKPGERNFSLLVLELCLLMKALNVSAEEAARILKDGREAIKDLHQTGVIPRLRKLLRGQLPNPSKRSSRQKPNSSPPGTPR